MALVVLKTNVLVHILVVSSSIILVRHLSKADYGMWRMIASMMAFLQLFFVGFDHAIVRFVPVESPRNADSVVLSVFIIKIVSSAVVLAILVGLYPYLPGLLNLPGGMESLFQKVFWLMVLATAVTPISTTLFPLASAHKLFHLILWVSVAKQSAMLMCVLAVVGLDLGLVHYLALETILNIAQVVLLWRGISITEKDRGHLWRALRSRNIWVSVWLGWRGYLRNYAMPLTLTSQLSYVRNHLPLILLGSGFSLQEAAVYSILKNVVTAVHKAQGSVIEGIFSRVFQLYEFNQAGFVKKFYGYMTLTYLMRFAVGSAMFIGAPLIFWVYKIEDVPYLRSVLGILVLEFLMSEILGVSNLVVMMSKKTTMLLVSAVWRFVIEAILLVFVTLRFGILGAATTLFLSRCTETISTVYFSDQILPLKRQYVLIAFVIVLFVFVMIRAIEV